VLQVLLVLQVLQVLLVLQALQVSLRLQECDCCEVLQVSPVLRGQLVLQVLLVLQILNGSTVPRWRRQP
jgi:archaellum biogenesis protein FlaJ (TadC family)